MVMAVVLVVMLVIGGWRRSSIACKLRLDINKI